MLRPDWPHEDEEEGEQSRQKERQGLGRVQIQKDDRTAESEGVVNKGGWEESEDF